MYLGPGGVESIEDGGKTMGAWSGTCWGRAGCEDGGSEAERLWDEVRRLSAFTRPVEGDGGEAGCGGGIVAAEVRGSALVSSSREPCKSSIRRSSVMLWGNSAGAEMMMKELRCKNLIEKNKEMENE